MDSLYRIRFSGTLMPGQEPQTVARRLAEKFRMPEKTAHELIQQGEGRLLKHNLDAAAAERYRAALSDLSAVRVAADQVLVDFDHKLEDVREVAFFPPMTGG